MKKILTILGVVALMATSSVYAADNPCSMKGNPCAMKTNPCAMQGNPCAAMNPCDMKQHKKQAKKAKKSANPCAMKGNPCAANPCAANK